MIDIKIKKPGAGFYLLIASLLFSIAAFVLYVLTYDALGYASDRWIIASMVIVFWSIVVLLATGLISGRAPKITDAFYWLAVIALTLATFKFIIPCLSPIGIYFTVHNMGDVEANAIGVPRAIWGAILFVLAIVLLIVSAFFRTAVKDKSEKKSRKKAVEPIAAECETTDADINEDMNMTDVDRAIVEQIIAEADGEKAEGGDEIKE